MKVGVTGTREGLSPAQKGALQIELQRLHEEGMVEFHHGGCIGVDTEAASFVQEEFKIVPVKHQGQAGTFLKRNREIVNSVDLLLVCPRGMQHESTGGTWYTHDYALKRGILIVIIWPNGETEAKH